MGDIDIGELFLNFMLKEKILKVAGVDITNYFPEELTSQHWTHCGMGFKSSPYQACQDTLHAEEMLQGDPLDISNPFHFDKVVLNLPGDPLYNLGKPWVYKYRTLDDRIALNLFIYVDNCHSTGFSFDIAWKYSWQVASYFNYLGIQDVPRK